MTSEPARAPRSSTAPARGWKGADRYDAVAATYESVRPTYLEELFTAIEGYASLRDHPTVIEVGAGTGQATRQMLDRGWQIDVVEPGVELVARARANTSSAAVRFHNSRFEDVHLEHEAFDLLTAATSWHWTDPHVSYQKAHDALRPGGVIALFWNAHVPDTPHPGWAPIRRAYVDVVPELADLAPLTPDRPGYDPAVELEQCGWFESIERHSYPFEVSYGTDQFLDLLDTYASHSSLTQEKRSALYSRLRSTIRSELGGRVVKPYRAVLVLGRRTDAASPGDPATRL